MTETSTPAAVTIASDPGAFGAALGYLGFADYTSGNSLSAGPWLATDHQDGLVRVVTYPQDGDRVEVIACDASRPTARLVDYKMSFDPTTPQRVVLAAIRMALTPAAG